MNKPNYRKTFADLQESILGDVDSILMLILPSRQYNSLKFLIDHTEKYRNCYRVIYGASFLSLTIEDCLSMFRANRYFLDSIGVEILPSRDCIAEFHRACTSNQIDLGLLISALRDHFGKISKLKHTIDEGFLEKNGYILIENVLDGKLCDELMKLTMSIASLESSQTKKGYFYGSGKLQRVYSLISKSEVYQELLLNSTVKQIMDHMFHRETFHDKYYLTSFHANILYPGAEAQIWHIDANVPEPIPPWIIRSNSNYVIQDLTAANGATEVYPGSHSWLRKPNHKEAEFGAAGETPLALEAPKGSLLFWHGHLWHRSGANRSKEERVALLGAYSASFMREISMEENPYLNLALNSSRRMKPAVQRILGYEHGAKHYN